MPIQIHGKPYYTVVERLKMLKADFKLDYSLTTELLKCDDKVVIVKATLSFGGNEYTGLALEVIGSSNINTHSYLMNCETSAIGRALSAANYLGSEYCSANEMESALDKEKEAEEVIIQEQASNDVATKRDEKHPLEDDIRETMGGIDISDKGEEITFGKHKGTLWSEVDEGYLDWVSKTLDKYKDKAKSELQRRSNQAAKQADLVTDEDVPF
tara:strand:- start:543 stop:1181 length:639 start_codon:yes stop_codon:yes gene_type:complete